MLINRVLVNIALLVGKVSAIDVVVNIPTLSSLSRTMILQEKESSGNSVP